MTNPHTVKVVIATKEKGSGEKAAGAAVNLRTANMELIRMGAAAPAKAPTNMLGSGAAADMALRTPRFTWSPHALCRDDFNMMLMGCS